MRLCFIADARSPTARSWISYFTAADHEVHVISTYPCGPGAVPGASLHVVPVAFSVLAANSNGDQAESPRPASSLARVAGGMPRAWLRPAFVELRRWLGPLDVHRHAAKVRRIVAEIGPDLVHAMRVPFEGLLAAEALRGTYTPLLISIWGNDLTFHANRSPLLRRMTRRAMKRADALNAECQFNYPLARKWGFSPENPWVALPGSGGVRPGIFYPTTDRVSLFEKWDIPEGSSVVLNPRGYQRHIRNDTFLRAIPKIAAARPGTVFLAVGMNGDRASGKLVRRLNVGTVIRMLPKVSQQDIADLFRLAHVTVSPSEHDGTPNTLLEAMACGAFPVAGDIEPLREWIDHGVNGFLCDPSSPESLASFVVNALGNQDLRRRAAVHNQDLVAQRADYGKVMARAEEFYVTVIQGSAAPAREAKPSEVV